ncbi:MAG: gamma carbonic anhydrase family protein [Lachnospirales bacterium]
MLIKFLDKTPKLDFDTTFIGEGAKLIGDVTIKDNVNIWYNAVIRGDESYISIDENTNIQENCTIHVSQNQPTTIGKNVTVGHNAILHGCTIEDNCLIGMGATILDGAVIGYGSLVGANALVTSGTIIPKNSLVLGSPAKVVKEKDFSEDNLTHAKHYVALSKNYK